MLPNSLKNLIENFKNLPGIGNKTAERLAYSMLDFEKDKLSDFASSIIDVRDKIKKCSICGNIADNDICNICSDDNRDKSTIFVVEKSKDIIIFEKLGVYNGSYHVLDGLISPLDGIGPDDINLKKLLNRINNNNVKEIIIALKPNIEGETTSQYIKKVINNDKINISKIANGVPIGTDMEYIDALTLELAIDERKSMN